MRYRITFEIDVHDSYREADVIEWARYECNDNGEMLTSNPLAHQCIDPIFGTFSIEATR